MMAIMLGIVGVILFTVICIVVACFCKKARKGDHVLDEYKQIKSVAPSEPTTLTYSNKDAPAHYMTEHH